MTKTKARPPKKKRKKQEEKNKQKKTKQTKTPQGLIILSKIFLLSICNIHSIMCYCFANDIENNVTPMMKSFAKCGLRLSDTNS